MKGFISGIENFFKGKSQSYAVYKDMMKQENKHALYYATGAAEAIYVLGAIWGYWMFHNWLLNIFLLSSLVFNFVLMLYAWHMRKEEECSYGRVQICCWLFVILQMGLIVCISIFPLRRDPAIFYPIVYLLLLLIFQFPIWQTVVTFTGVTVGFCLLSFRFKPIDVAFYDLTIALSTYIISFLFLFLIAKRQYKAYDLQLELKARSITDYLTGLQNRRGMDKTFEEAYLENIENGKPVSMLVIDIDYFKKYNDTFGHTVGDEYLSRLGERLLQFSRENQSLVARYGGEEFSVLFTNCDERTAISYAKELLVRLQDKSPQGDIVTVSIGAATDKACGRQKNSLHHLFMRADAALYCAKNNGRNCVASEKEIYGNKKNM